MSSLQQRSRLNRTRQMGFPQPEHSDNSVELSRLTVAKTAKPHEDMPMEPNCESNSEFSVSEIKDSSESSDDNHEETLNEICRVEDELNIGGSHVLEGRDYALVSQPTVDDYYREKTCSTSGTSFLHQQFLGSALVNTTSNVDVAAGLSSTEIHGAPGITHEVALHSVLSPEVLGDGHPHFLSRVTEAIDGHSSGSGTISPDSGSLFLDSDEVQADVSPSEGLPPGLELLWSSREQSQQTDGVVQVDIVAVSSDLASDISSDTSSWESRRRGRRMFWDVISRHGSRGQGDLFTSIFATEDSSYLESHDRWPFDSNDDMPDWVEERHFRSRFHRSQRRRRPRSEIWDRLRFGLEASSSRCTSCPSGLYPDGMCSCDSILSSEESSSRTSISRIVLLAEALFEVLDELHRQPIFPLLSPVSLPAPGPVVDSFPLKSHQKKSSAENEENDEQCYICLVLPCKHEYHMHCVDRWLKEIHGICRLCRGDVCKGST
ncbi:hypothetical protein MLD38_006785 [Melastoma candidum]|uniref:Uncharacterized protein n=1 Tax=Melastoma candidum TaxID=119954 RepID=A0ACB9RSS0_9MYRT|nr:hypothetical protein MLD38_006785 [Melastoma candidum]